MRQRVSGSAHVEWIDWDPATRVLEVEFRGGRLYRYEGVDYDTWVALQQSPSKGSFLRSRIQPHHRTKAVA